MAMVVSLYILESYNHGWRRSQDTEPLGIIIVKELELLIHVSTDYLILAKQV
jgi:hypothetical protein